LYSNVIAIKTGHKPGNEITSTVFDTENNILQVSVNSESDASAIMTVYDLSGKIVFTNSVTLTKGTTVVKTALPELAKGAYLINLQLADTNMEGRFVN